MSDDDGTTLTAAVVPAFSGIEIKRPGYSLYLNITDNHLECRCGYVPNVQGTMLTREELAAILIQYGVLLGVDQEAFENFVVNAAAGRQQSDVLLASGTPPVDGVDEYFVQTVPVTTTDRSEDEDDDNVRVDMYSVQTFVNVLADEEIGRIVPAESGTPGMDMKGLPIPPKAGKSLQSKIGKNIRVEENGTLLIAAAAGRFCRVAGELSVEDEYAVKGDVNFRTGGIDFKGLVAVRGDVLDNFAINATKGLTVAGNIGKCRIVSDGDVTFNGMDGDNKGSIICGGTLRARYIHDAVIECAGDVIVEVEIHDCTIRTLGRIIVNKDTISGGSYIARRGIEAKKLGSPSAKHTSLLVGVDYRYLEELKRLLEELTETQNKIREAYSLDEFKELRDTAANLRERIKILRGKALETGNAKINVKAKLHENVQMAVGDVTETVNEKKDGPLSIVNNTIDGCLRFIPMSALDVKAADIEKAFILEHNKR